MHKNLTLVFGLLLFAVSTNAQKLKTMITDSGDTLYSTPDIKVYTKAGAPRSIADYLKTSVYKTSYRGQPVLGLEIQTGRTSAFTIDKGAEMQILLKDGRLVQLYCRRDTESRISKLDYGCYIFPFYTIDTDSKDKLETGEIVSIVIMSSLGKMNYEIKSKFEDSIAKQLKLIQGR